ncbi:hypothetical protein PRCB_16385 [Pantoea rodasii]|uniref:Uncharacterized protein n=1 Tax=Pantoea rodasii TaxID=1076549 RepID=A0A2M9WBR1_9GAMM|nr:hypothetical protein [Pantoea rodasii]ORM64510.1 hypothetical protein HA45_09055 [Pantoea rodasii]PJZ04980.1 hypothetical protein PRCB_16385 [Pantoea rodasii]
MATKNERLEHANQLIQVISAHGRRFFYNDSTDMTSKLLVDKRGRVWFLDDYTLKWVFTHKTTWTNKWRGFSHGGTLRGLVEMMRDYIIHGTQIHPYYLGMERRNVYDGNIWGYPDDAIKAVRDQASLLPIIAEVKSHA